LTIRQRVRRVIVDVMVRDAHGKPVHGLTEGDFSITEDKQPQRVLSFDVYDFDKASIARTPNSPPLPPNVFVNLPTVAERGPLYVMLYDMVNMENEDQITARQQVLKFIKSKPAGTRFAIFVASDMLRLVQGFTEDKDQLYAALDPKSPKPHAPRIFLYARNYGRGDPYTAVDALTHIGQYLDGIPGRKNLIWVSGSFPLAIAPQEGDSAYWQTDVKAEINSLAQAQVAVFPLNVRGVIVNPEGALTGGQPGGGSTASNAINSGSSSLTRDYATQDTLATATGGRAIYSDNDLSSMLADATEDGGNYYTLTYSPPNQGDDGKCHNIAVKLDKTEYQLSYRRYYCRVPVVSAAAEENGGSAGSPTVAVPLQAGDVLQANMRQGAPMVHDLIFSAHLRTEGGAVMATPGQMEQLSEQTAFFQTHRRNKPAKPLAPVRIQKYVVDYRVLDPQLKATATRTGQAPGLEFAVAAFDSEGKTLNGIVNDGVSDTAAQVADNKAGLFRVRQALDVPVNAVWIRVGVRDRLSERMGTIEVSLPLAAEGTH
jgi:VWFA-related protein